jgi:hypothetical protein
MEVRFMIREILEDSAERKVIQQVCVDWWDQYDRKDHYNSMVSSPYSVRLERNIKPDNSYSTITTEMFGQWWVLLEGDTFDAYRDFSGRQLIELAVNALGPVVTTSNQTQISSTDFLQRLREIPHLRKRVPNRVPHK